MRKLRFQNGALADAADIPGLPAPTVRIQYLTHKGVTRSERPLIVTGVLEIKTDVPAQYFDAGRVQIELLRYRVTHKRKSKGVTKVSPAGFYHPSTWVDQELAVPIGGVRGGGGGGAVNRPTEWVLTSNQTLNLSGGLVLAPWFEIERIVVDRADKETLGVYIGAKRKRKPGSGPPRIGVFAFRYATFVDGQWLTGPLSNRVYARPRIWPTTNVIDNGRKVYAYNPAMTTELLVSLHAKVG
jgi:hypothetical protein